MEAFNKIFKKPKLHAIKTVTKERPTSAKKLKETYQTIDRLGVATVKVIVSNVDFGKSSVRSCINKLIADGKVEENSTRIIGKGRTTDYRVTV